LAQIAVRADGNRRPRGPDRYVIVEVQPRRCAVQGISRKFAGFLYYQL